MRHVNYVERVTLMYLTLVVVIGMIRVIVLVDGSGVCGNLTPKQVAHNLYPCASAAKNKNLTVSKECCNEMIKHKKECLCAILLSPQVKRHGINPSMAVTIPKRCNFHNRPVGYKCGAYSVP